MKDGAFFFGVLGAIVGAAVPASVFLLHTEPLGGCRFSCGRGSFRLHLHDYQSGAFSPSNGHWRPWVDEATGVPPFPDEGPLCPRGGTRRQKPQLLVAPLPAAFDPSRAPQELSACVLVRRDGRVAAARLVGAGTAQKAAGLLPAIRAGWRFAPRRGRPIWVRVRLSSQVTRRPPDVGVYPL